MEEIKILFFIVGAFFGVNQSNVIAEKTSVTVNPQEKTIVILQENLIAIVRNENDSLNVQNELKQIVQSNNPWSSEFTEYSKKEKHFSISKDSTSLNLKISLTYNSDLDLKAFGIDKKTDGMFSMTNFPKSHTKSADGTLGERYWNFEANKPFTFTEEPFTDIPEEFKIYIKSLLPFWKTLKQ